MNITIFVSSPPHGSLLQDLEWPDKHPLGGSETAALRLAQALKSLGENVKIITDANELVHHQCDVFISLRIWQVFHEGFYPGKRNFLWCHDDIDQPLVKPLENPQIALPIYNRLDGVILLSHYVSQRWISTLNLPLTKLIKSINGIPLNRFTPNPEKLTARKPWAYYSSTPFRGLELLLLTWPYILQHVPDAQLHICSSMKVYNPKGDSDEKYQPLYEKASTMPGVTYHGSLGQAELRDIAQQCRVLAYPCIFPENCPISAMEAMAAGCVVVSTLLGGMSEIAWQNPLIPIADGWLNQWIREVIRALNDNQYYEQLALQNLDVAKYYDWDRVAREWIKFLKQ